MYKCDSAAAHLTFCAMSVQDTGRTLMEDLKNTDPESRQQLMGQALREVESLLGRGKL